MFLLGYNTNGFAHHRLEDALTILAELGYQSVALTLDLHALDPYDRATPGQLITIRAMLKQFGMRSVIETGARFLLNPRRKHQPTLLSATENARQQRLDFLCRAVDVAAALESDAVSFWAGTPLDDPGNDVLLDRLVAGCRQLAQHAERQGVTLAFEPEPGMFIDTMERFAELEERVAHPLFGLTIDLGHLHCQGEEIVPNLERWAQRLRNVHIEDMRRGVHDHLMFGQGEMDFGPILGTLNRVGYQGGVHVELSRQSHDAVETARQALHFLRSALA
ncbi:MAG: sugar phosphate isomerase/epimerase family protein [Gemmataceae bacterium]